jgi:3-hydroxy-9,10-secoandrosta-1,3,5(10)-triene-9,17-dione monooxygenase reductase component
MNDGDRTNTGPLASGHRAIGSQEFRAVMGHFCTGVAIVTGRLEEQLYGFVVQSVQSISLNPPLVSISPATTSRSWPAIRSTGSFCLNFLPACERRLCTQFAQSGMHKFNGVNWRASIRGSPIIEAAIGYVDCKIEAEHGAGDHTIVLGRVMDLSILLADAQPLLFFRGRFGSFIEESA